MAKEATLTINDSSYPILHCHYRFYRPTDAKGRPRHGLRGGEVYITMETVIAKDLLEIVAETKQPVSGKLEVWEDEDGGALYRPRLLEWEEAHIYAVGEMMISRSPLPMLTEIGISPLRFDINRNSDLRLDRRWPQVKASWWEQYVPKEQKPFTVGKPQSTTPEIVEEVIEGEAVLNVNTDQVGIISKKQQQVLEQEIKWCEAFVPHMECFLKQEDDPAKEAMRLYKTHAVLLAYKDFLDAVDDDAQTQQIIDNLDTIIEQYTRKLKADADFYKSVTVNGHDIKDKVISELLWVRGKRMVRVRSQKIKPHNRWFNRQQVQQQLNSEHTNENKQAGKTLKQAEIQFFKKEFWNESGGLHKNIEEFNKKCNHSFFSNSEVLDSRVSAQFLRYSTDAVAGSSFTWGKDTKELKIGAKAQASFTAATCQGTFNIYVPDQHGFGLIQWLKSEAPEYIDDDFTELFLKIQLSTKGSAFVGACASVSAELGLALSQTDNKAVAQARVELFAGAKAQTGVELFAGAKAQTEASFSIDTMYVDDEALDSLRAEMVTAGQRDNATISGKAVEEKGLGKWERLCKASVGAYGVTGFEATATFKFGYVDGHFRFQAKIGATVKLGVGTFLNGEVDAKNVGRFILTIANGFNWKNISNKLTDESYRLYHGLMANCFYTGKKIDEIYQQIAGNIDAVMLDITRVALNGLDSIKAADDTMDKYLPGYSSFKQYNIGFIILKSTYYYLQQINKELGEKEAAINVVEKAQQEPVRWNYATWQMKVNLIYDMRHGGSGWLGGFSQERKEDAIIAVLESSRSKTEFWKIVKGLEDVKEISGREVVILDEVLDCSQQDRLDYLRNVKFRK